MSDPECLIALEIASFEDSLSAVAAAGSRTFVFVFLKYQNITGVRLISDLNFFNNLELN